MILPLRNNASNMWFFSLAFQCVFTKKTFIDNYYKPDTVLSQRDIAQNNRDKFNVYVELII